MITSRRSLLAAAALAPVVALATTATAEAAYVHDYDLRFTTPVGSWPGNGSAPAGYRSGRTNLLSYGDGTHGMYYPSKVLSIHDGLLDFYDHNGMGAAVLPFGYSGFLYGTFSVRMSISGPNGYRKFHDAFMLWPDSDTWPGDGEIDVVEADTRLAHPFISVHPAASTDSWTRAATPLAWNDSVLHTYTCQWGPGFMAGYQDGALVYRSTTKIPHNKMHPVFQSGWAGTSKPSSDFSGHTYVRRVTFDHSYSVKPSHFF